MVNTQKLNSKNTILFEVIRHVTLYYVPITILLTVAQVSFEYFAIKNQIEKNISELITNFNDSLTNSLWTYNNEQTDTILSGIHKSTYVVGLDLKNEFGQIITTLGTTPNNKKIGNSLHQISHFLKVDQLFEFKKKLFMTSKKDGNIHVGAINIYSGNSIIIEKLSRTLFYIIIGSLVKATFLWIILIYFFNMKIVKPTQRLVQKIKATTPESPKPIDEDVSENITELYDIQTSFNQLIVQVRNYKNILEAVVDNKTELLKEKDIELGELFTKLSSVQTKLIEDERELLKKLAVTQLFNELKPQLEVSYDVLSQVERSHLTDKQIIAYDTLSSCLSSIDTIVNSSIINSQGDDLLIETDLVLFTQKTLSDWQTIYLNNHHEFESVRVEFDSDEIISVNVFQSDIERLLFNLLNTALISINKRLNSKNDFDYRPCIEVVLKNYAKDMVLISVHDNGHGFNAKELYKLEKLEEGDFDTNAAEQVNLYLSQETAAKYNGKLSISSEVNSFTEVQTVISKGI